MEILFSIEQGRDQEMEAEGGRSSTESITGKKKKIKKKIVRLAPTKPKRRVSEETVYAVESGVLEAIGGRTSAHLISF